MLEVHIRTAAYYREDKFVAKPSEVSARSLALGEVRGPLAQVGDQAVYARRVRVDCPDGKLPDGRDYVINTGLSANFFSAGAFAAPLDGIPGKHYLTEEEQADPHMRARLLHDHLMHSVLPHRVPSGAGILAVDVPDDADLERELRALFGFAPEGR